MARLVAEGANPDQQWERELPEGQAVDVQAHLDANRIPSFAEGQPVRVVVNTLKIGP